MTSSSTDPVKTSVSVPPPPRTTSEPSPGSQVNVSLPPPRDAVSCTPVAVDDVVAAAADERLVAVAADEGVVAALAVDARRLGGREAAIGGIDPDPVAAVAGLDVDGPEGRELELVVGRAVVAHVDLEPVRVGPAQAEGDPVPRRGPRDDEGAVDDGRP